MADTTDLDRIARSFPGVSVGPYWSDPAAYLLKARRGGRGFVHRRPPSHQEGVVDLATGEPFADLLVVHVGTPEAKTQALAEFDSDVVFDIPHFARTSAVLVHLDTIPVTVLEDLLALAHAARTG